MTRDRRDKLIVDDGEFRKRGVGIALRALGVARELFDHEFPINSKFHIAVFSIFDTSTLLCSAIIHDCDCVLPRRQEIVDVIGSSLEMLHQLSLITKLGASSYNFLFKLVHATPELSRKSPVRKRQKQTTLSAPDSLSKPEDFLIPATTSTDTTFSPHTTTLQTPPSTTESEDVSFYLEQFYARNPFGDLGTSANFDLGGMEQIWDWETLHLDDFTHNGSAM
ncbi:hypothetical protein GQ44DRAFT_723776 [Phaeosphaeriaceae sp. PMI808]|nr:hypothetical protein GQ44DRAFT_723776 [Phaeosphaeriaceae sp. PMI808]